MTVAAVNRPQALLALCRPRQWLKNSFVFAGLLFGHRWNDTALVWRVCIAALSFCAIASAVYVVNDIVDQENDRRHPKKRIRPIAARTVTLPVAWLLVAFLTSIALLLASAVSWVAVALLASYTTLNIAYSIHFKHIVILDVFCIAGGFMIRILVGTLGVGIPPSKWLLLCGLMTTLFLGFEKRRAELLYLEDAGVGHRSVLEHYGAALLDQFGAICAAGVIVTYCLYTTSTDTIAVHHTTNLIFTAPFVIYALFRYLYLVHKRRRGGDPSHDLFRDKHIAAALLAWVATYVGLLMRVD